MHEGPVAAPRCNRPAHPPGHPLSLCSNGKVKLKACNNHHPHPHAMSGPVHVLKCDSPDSNTKRSETSPLLACGTMEDPSIADVEIVEATEIYCGEAVLSQVGANMNGFTAKDGDKTCENNGKDEDSTQEDWTHDLLRIVKHKPSAIVFSDFNQKPESRAALANESLQLKEVSSSTETTEGEEDEEDEEEEEEDDFPEASQYKEFLVSRHRRNSSRNRKCLRKKQDAHPSSNAGWQKTTAHNSSSRSTSSSCKGRVQSTSRDEKRQQGREKEGAGGDSMTILMKKLDQINHEIRDASSSPSDDEQNGEHTHNQVFYVSAATLVQQASSIFNDGCVRSEECFCDLTE
uniref:Uncharacterized protein n=1 Tax=Knipowitschia caucasica TaxID=637954 RepID=A0AAV2JCB3_KNICA